MVKMLHSFSRLLILLLLRCLLCRPYLHCPRRCCRIRMIRTNGLQPIRTCLINRQIRMGLLMVYPARTVNQVRPVSLV